jgi:hypothetical protein
VPAIQHFDLKEEDKVLKTVGMLLKEKLLRNASAQAKINYSREGRLSQIVHAEGSIFREMNFAEDHI